MAGTARRSEEGSWALKLEALEAALRAQGRLDLVEECVAPMRRCLDTHPDPTGELKSLFGDAIRDIKACILDPERQPSAAIYRALGDGAEAWGEASTPAEMLAGLAQAGDDELLGLLDSVDWDAGAAGARVKDELGTLREPLVGQSVDGEQARVLMKGELQPGLLSDLIQLFAQNQETGRLLIENRDSRQSGSLYFVNGHLANAICEGEDAERGFYNVMRIPRGRFYYQRGVEVREVKIERATQHLILDTLRLIDEAS